MTLEMKEYLALQTLSEVYYEKLSIARKSKNEFKINRAKDNYHDVKLKMNEVKKKYNLTFARQ